MSSFFFGESGEESPEEEASRIRTANKEGIGLHFTTPNILPCQRLVGNRILDHRGHRATRSFQMQFLREPCASVVKTRSVQIRSKSLTSSIDRATQSACSPAGSPARR